MIIEFWNRHIAMMTVAFAAMAAAIYLIMVGATLAHIEAVSHQVPLDMRPFGYGPADIEELMTSLGVDGRRYYLTRQIPLDTAYPALLTLTLMSAMRWISSKNPTDMATRVGIIAALGAGAFDYAENGGIVVMLLSWPDVSVATAYLTCAATVAKSSLTVLAVLVLLSLGIRVVIRHRTAIPE